MSVRSLTFCLVLLAAAGCSFHYDSAVTPVAANGSADGGAGAKSPGDATPQDGARRSSGSEPTAADGGESADAKPTKVSDAEKLGGEPGDKSSDKPAGKTGDQPGENQGAKPAEKTAEGQSEKPGEAALTPDGGAAPASKPDGKAEGKAENKTEGKSGRGPLPIESTSRRAVQRDGNVEVITFDDLNIGMQADMVYRDFLLTDRVRELDGKRVRLVGYIFGGVSQLKDLKEFIVLKNLECKFGPGGQADHLIRVMMKGEHGADYTDTAVQLEGVLKLNPYMGPDGNTWSVYDLETDKVKDLKKR
ncbi:MAG TPA: hypothetical protein PLV92_03625 [Pirellulaceae bacterium]|nr:hypothetical protein [Pirellulaceae bacterium]